MDRAQIKRAVTSLAEQYKSKEGEFDKFKADYNIRPAVRSS
jgi:prefoldin subunit 2